MHGAKILSSRYYKYLTWSIILKNTSYTDENTTTFDNHTYSPKKVIFEFFKIIQNQIKNEYQKLSE